MTSYAILKLEHIVTFNLQHQVLILFTNTSQMFHERTWFMLDHEGIGRIYSKMTAKVAHKIYAVIHKL